MASRPAASGPATARSEGLSIVLAALAIIILLMAIAGFAAGDIPSAIR